MAIMKEAKTLTFGDTQYVVVDAEAREKIAELEQSANETLPALKQQIETHSSDNNAHSDIRDAIPTKVSQLANDSQFITQESDPTVPAWAKQPNKPSYVASEVGAEPAGTSSTVVSQHNTSNVAHADIRDLIAGLTSRLNALADSDDTTLDQMSEVVAYIKANKNLIDSITTSKVNVKDIIDNLTSNITNKPLSAAQGVVLKSQIDGLNDELDNHNHDTLYYTKSQIDNQTLITVDEIDAICGTTISYARNMRF